MTRHETGRTTERTVVTRRQLADALTTLGVRPGDVAVVHSSLRAFGFVVGGAQAVYEALREAVGPDGTLVMPAFTPQLCHPATWRAPDLVRTDPAAAAAGMPVFDPLRTPVSRTMGVLPELLRALPGSLRSPHPHVSFVAEGPRARRSPAPIRTRTGCRRRAPWVSCGGSTPRS